METAATPRTSAGWQTTHDRPAMTISEACLHRPHGSLTGTSNPVRITRQNVVRSHRLLSRSPAMPENASASSATEVTFSDLLNLEDHGDGRYRGVCHGG